ncbi:MAG: shikimate kinase [Clostridia bacterium]|nr:shikimate kinase [Clostridia bacterium]
MGSKYGLLGEKLSHSVSPQIHTEFGNKDYVLFEVLKNNIKDFLKDPDLKGLNVTIPYKQTVIEYCDSIDKSAYEIGSINTMKRDKAGIWRGYNTDYFGFLYMTRCAGISFLGQNVLILGSGGVSKTAQAAAKKEGADSIKVVSRNGEYNYSNLEKCKDATIIVNATPVGMYPNIEESLIDLDNFPNVYAVVELIYNPCRTALVQQAIKKGILYTQGFQMLVAQAKYAHEIFFDKKISSEEMVRVGSKLQGECENIVLVGMPGSGKSTIGKIVSKLSQKEVYDSDEEIVKKYKKSIPEIFKEDGEKVFRQMEYEVIKELSRKRGVIIITGGGAVTTDENEKLLKANGRIYQIVRATQNLEKDGRPLSISGDLEQMAKIRMPLYDRFANVKISNDNVSPQEAAEEIWREFCEYTCNQWA